MPTIEQARRLVGRLDGRPIRYATIDVPQAMKILRELPGDAEIFTTTLTTPEMYLTGNPHRDALVCKRRRVVVKQDYEAAVNERRGREGKSKDFKAAARRWGGKIEAPFVLHQVGGEWRLYLSLHVLKDLGAEYYGPGFRPIHPDDILPFIKVRAEGPRQGLGRPVVYRDYDITHVLAFQVPGARGGVHGYIIDMEPESKKTRAAAPRPYARQDPRLRARKLEKV